MRNTHLGVRLEDDDWANLTNGGLGGSGDLANTRVLPTSHSKYYRSHGHSKQDFGICLWRL